MIKYKTYDITIFANYLSTLENYCCSCKTILSNSKFSLKRVTL